MSAASPLSVRITRAAITSGGSETVGRFLTIFLSIATARALVPEQVGLLGMAVIVVGLVSMLASYAETAAVVSPASHDAEYSLAASVARAALTVLPMLAIVTLIPMLAPRLVGAGAAAEELTRLVRFLAWQPVVETLGAYPRVLLQRRLDLVVIAVANLVQAVVHVSLAVALLWHGLGPDAVVWGALAGVGAGAIVPWLRIAGESFDWSWPSRAVTAPFSANFARIFTNGFFTYANAQADKVLVAGTLGPAAMSYYGMAWNASRFPSGVLAQSLRYSLVPAVAQLQGDRRSVERALVESLRYSIFLAVPVATALVVTAPSLVLVVLGERWLPVVPALRVMAVSILVAPFLECAAALLIGMGRAHLTAYGSTLSLAALVVLTPLLALRFGVAGAAYGNLGSSIALAGTLAFTAHAVFPEIRWLRATIVAIPFGAAVVAGLGAVMAGSALEPGFVRLMVEGTTFVVIYLAGVSLGGGRDVIAALVTLLRRSAPTARLARRPAG